MATEGTIQRPEDRGQNASTPVKLLRRYVMGFVVDQEAKAFAYLIARRDMEYGTHYIWERGDEYFTEAGIALITDRLGMAFPSVVAAIEKAVADARAALAKRRVYDRARRPAKVKTKTGGGAVSGQESPLSRKEKTPWWLRD